MRFRHSRSTSDEKIQLQMTPMIDIVFLLLVFFIMTFRIVVQEGDFQITMPRTAPSEGMPDEESLPPLTLHLTADPSGALAGIRLNERSFADFEGLHAHIRGLIGDASGPGSFRDTAEVKIEADYQLRYRHAIEAITAVSGFRQGDRLVKLIDKIQFSPPQPPTE